MGIDSNPGSGPNILDIGAQIMPQSPAALQYPLVDT